MIPNFDQRNVATTDKIWFWFCTYFQFEGFQRRHVEINFRYISQKNTKFLISQRSREEFNRNYGLEGY